MLGVAVRGRYETHRAICAGGKSLSNFADTPSPQGETIVARIVRSGLSFMNDSPPSPNARRGFSSRFFCASGERELKGGRRRMPNRRHNPLLRIASPLVTKVSSPPQIFLPSLQRPSYNQFVG